MSAQIESGREFLLPIALVVFIAADI